MFVHRRLGSDIAKVGIGDLFKHSCGWMDYLPPFVLRDANCSPTKSPSSLKPLYLFVGVTYDLANLQLGIKKHLKLLKVGRCFSRVK